MYASRGNKMFHYSIYEFFKQNGGRSKLGGAPYVRTSHSSTITRYYAISIRLYVYNLRYAPYGYEWGILKSSISVTLDDICYVKFSLGTDVNLYFNLYMFDKSLGYVELSLFAFS